MCVCLQDYLPAADDDVLFNNVRFHYSILLTLTNNPHKELLERNSQKSWWRAVAEFGHYYLVGHLHRINVLEDPCCRLFDLRKLMGCGHLQLRSLAHLCGSDTERLQMNVSVYFSSDAICYFILFHSILFVMFFGAPVVSFVPSIGKYIYTLKNVNKFKGSLT
ncbi:hypothetical protein CEXT_657291 [Caerostris extrusa]|uniref:Uncharacterized protein n=1 Tax=Caerostris extrusa TaxID=172846 RepID=A0AAV4PW78_CAEEX|nr:hypothetical protein CEXT_657291 [Caerostris extrusa]